MLQRMNPRFPHSSISASTSHRFAHGLCLLALSVSTTATAAVISGIGPAVPDAAPGWDRIYRAASLGHMSGSYSTLNGCQDAYNEYKARTLAAYQEARAEGRAAFLRDSPCERRSSGSYAASITGYASGESHTAADGWRIGYDSGYIRAVRYDDSLYNLVLPDTIQHPDACTAGNPVDVATGAKYQREADIPGALPFIRHYSSAGDAAGTLWRHMYQYALEDLGLRPVLEGGVHLRSAGYASRADACRLGWAELQPQLSAPWASQATAEYDAATEACNIIHDGRSMSDARVAVDSTLPPQVHTVQVRRPDGSTLRYQRVSEDQWTPIGAHTARLERLTDGDWQLTTDANTVEHYDSRGPLSTITRPGGGKLRFTHDAHGQLSEVRDTAGRTLHLDHVDHRLVAVETDDGARHAFSHDGSGRLIQVQRPDGTTRRYHYENDAYPQALTGLTDETGTRYATWAYDDAGRAVLSEHADGAERTELAFNSDGTTTVTNPLGKQTTYHFARVAGSRRVTRVDGHASAHCAAANQAYTYTPEGWLASRTDWNGTVTRFEYNDRGLVVRRVDAEGTPAERETRTEWHPELRLPVRIIEAQRTTEITYDDRGRETGRTVRAH